MSQVKQVLEVKVDVEQAKKQQKKEKKEKYETGWEVEEREDME